MMQQMPMIVVPNFEQADLSRSIEDRIAYWGVLHAFERKAGGRMEIMQHIKELNHKLAELNSLR